MAYVLGYFAADGCMSRNKRGAHFIEFTSTDKQLLLLVQSLLGSNHAISVRNRFPLTQKAAYRLQIGSKQVFNDLASLGFTPAKSLTLKLPAIPKPYFGHFTRGYFDGDGHASIIKPRNRPSNIIQSGFTSGSKQFLADLHTKLKEYARIEGGYLGYHQGYRLNFSVNDSLRLYEFMYQNGLDYCLKRKFLVFRKYITHTWTGSSVG